MDDQVLLKRTPFKGKHKIQDHWEGTVYCVVRQQYNGMPFFNIAPVTGGGKVRIVHQNFLLLFKGNIEGDPANKENWQDINDPKDSTSADSDSRGSEAEVVLADPKPVGEGDAIHVQHIQIEEKPNYWTQFIWSWMKTLYEQQ